MDAELYHRMVTYIQKTDTVLTEHVGFLNLKESREDRLIYQQDTAWLRESDLVIGEVTCPSLGVGYELAYAERYGKPCYLFYNPKKTDLSAMLTGDDYFHIFSYEKEEEIYPVIDAILSSE